MAECLPQNTGDNIDFNNSKSVIKSLLNLFRVPSITAPVIPTPIVLASGNRPGLSPTSIAATIIKRQAEAGIPVGALPDGQVSPSEIMERIRVEEIVKALTQDARITVAVNAGIPIQSTGANAGGPVTTAGTTIQYGKGNAVIQ